MELLNVNVVVNTAAMLLNIATLIADAMFLKLNIEELFEEDQSDVEC